MLSFLIVLHLSKPEKNAGVLFCRLLFAIYSESPERQTEKDVLSEVRRSLDILSETSLLVYPALGLYSLFSSEAAWSVSIP